MSSEQRPWKRQREDFWRAHHEAWKRSDLNQRQYCEFHGLPQKAFENWRQMFRLEPEPPQRKLLYRCRPIRPPLSPPVSPPLSPEAYPSSQLAAPIVQRPTGFCLFTKRLEHGVFLWPPSIAPGETLSLTSAQLSLLIDGVDWRVPEQRWRPAVAG